MDKFKQTIEWRGAGTKLPTGGASKKAGGGGDMSPSLYVKRGSGGIRDFKRNIVREKEFYIIAGSGINKNTMARCGKVIHV